MNLQDMVDNSAKAVKLLKAVSNERRLLILCHLLSGELSVGEMNDKLRTESVGIVTAPGVITS